MDIRVGVLLGLVMVAGSTVDAQGLQGGARTGGSRVPDFSIHFPPGDWEASRNPALSHIALLERRPDAPSRATRIDVRIARPDPSRRTPAGPLAGQVVEREMAAMKARMPVGHVFQSSPFDTVVGCRRIQGTRYALARRGGQGRPTEAGVVVAWVSPNYRQDGRVVVFRHAGAGRTLQEMAREAGPLYHVIDRMELGGVAGGGC